MSKIIQKPILTILTLILVILAIFYLQSQDVSVNQEKNISIEPTKEIKVEDGKYPKAPELNGITGWINTEPLTLKQLQGKVVLVDFWTYTCINCIRTFPYLTSWDKKYRNMGLVIIGVHTPEFEFEKEKNNVVNAAKKYNLEYPIAQDNAYQTWRAYQNRYWPHEYLIDAQGFIRHEHIGEGGYEETEQAIQDLLNERMLLLGENKTVHENLTKEQDLNLDILTPEIYLGYQTSRGNFGEHFKPDEETTYTLPEEFKPNQVYLEGTWKAHPDSLELTSDEGTIILRYYAPAVNIVANSLDKSEATPFLNQEAVTSQTQGKDILNGKAVIQEARLYNLVRKQPNLNGDVLKISLKGKGFKIYTFTFG